MLTFLRSDNFFLLCTHAHSLILLYLLLSAVIHILALCLITGLYKAWCRALADAETDPLTGLGNRRKARRLWLAIRKKKGVVVATADIDNFKHINDTYGHDAGDCILRETARLLSEELPTARILARTGGEEFMVVFNHTTLMHACLMTEHLRQKIERHAFYFHTRGPVPVTMSFGLAEATDNTHLESVCADADAALYAAKRNGRNRTGWYRAGQVPHVVSCLQMDDEEEEYKSVQ